MATLDILLKCEASKPVPVRHLDGMLFSQDAQGNQIMVAVTRNGAPETLGGSVSANFVRADGSTVVQSGSVSGNVATVVMPAAAYAVPGPIAVFIKHTASDATATIAAFTAYVYKSSTDTIVDPGTVVPNVNELLAMVDECEDAADAANAAAAAATAAIESAFNGLSSQCTDIPSQSDFNDLTTPGNYKIQSNSAATSMANGPTGLKHASRVYVFQIHGTSYLFQLIITRYGDIYTRVYSNKWEEWSNIPKGDLMLSGDPAVAKTIASNSDFNDLTDYGNYKVESNESMRSMENRPCDYSGRLFVLGSTGSSYIYQIYMNGAKGYLHTRAKAGSSGWSEWTEMDNSILRDEIGYSIDKEETIIPNIEDGTLVDEYYVDYTNGSYNTQNEHNTNYHRTSMIKIPANTTAIRMNFYNASSGSAGYAFYDDNRNFITNSGGKNFESGAVRNALTIYPIPNGAKYIICSGNKSYEETETIDGVTTAVPRTVSFINGHITKSTGKNFGENIVMLGDSIIGKYDGSDSIPNFVEQITGAKCYNCGFGGTSMGTDDNGTAEYYTYLSPFDGWKIIRSITTGDFSGQDAVIEADPYYEHIYEYFPEHLDTLKNMDWSTVDVITISYGTNDWGTKVTLEDNGENPKDTNTFGGALRTALEQLWSVYPHIKVIIFGCVWRGFADGGILTGSSDDKEDPEHPIHKGTIKQYEEKAEEVAKEYHVPFVPMYDHTNFNPHTWLHYFHTSDATHPARNGRQAMAKRYAMYIAQV